MSFWDDIGESLDFEVFQLDKWWEMIKEDPERLLMGSADPLGAELWGGVTGKDYEPMVNVWGGPTEETFAEAGEAGIDTGTAEDIHAIAEGIAQAYTLNWGLGEMGAMFEGAEGGAGGAEGAEGGAKGGKKIDADMLKQGFQQFASSMQQQQAEQDKPMEVPPPTQQGEPVSTFETPAPGLAVAAPGTAVIPEPSLPPEPVPEETFPRRV